jgi:hypothetical protein
MLAVDIVVNKIHLEIIIDNGPFKVFGVHGTSKLDIFFTQCKEDLVYVFMKVRIVFSNKTVSCSL